MREPRVMLVFLLILTGCEAEREYPSGADLLNPVSPAVTATPPAAPTVPSVSKEEPEPIVPRATRSEKPVVVRATYGGPRHVCSGGPSFVMLREDVFRVADVIEGRLNARIIHVRPLTTRGRDYPKEPTVGATYTLRLWPTEASLKQDEKDERDGWSVLYVDGDEVELVSPTPAGKGGA